MCHLSMKLSDTFDQNPACTFDKIREKPILMKTHSHLDLESKGQGHSKNQKTMPQGAINKPSTKKISRDSPNYLCPNDVKIVINDLLTITERGQQRSRVTR